MVVQVLAFDRLFSVLMELVEVISNDFYSFDFLLHDHYCYYWLLRHVFVYVMRAELNVREGDGGSSWVYRAKADIGADI